MPEGQVRPRSDEAIPNRDDRPCGVGGVGGLFRGHTPHLVEKQRVQGKHRTGLPPVQRDALHLGSGGGTDCTDLDANAALIFQQRHHLLRHLLVFDVPCNTIAPKVPHVSEMQVEHAGDNVRGGDGENRRTLAR